jgi:hypothetical protein
MAAPLPPLVRDHLKPIEQWVRGFAKSSIALTAR